MSLQSCAFCDDNTLRSVSIWSNAANVGSGAEVCIASTVSIVSGAATGLGVGAPACVDAAEASEGGAERDDWWPEPTAGCGGVKCTELAARAFEGIVAARWWGEMGPGRQMAGVTLVTCLTTLCPSISDDHVAARRCASGACLFSICILDHHQRVTPSRGPVPIRPESKSCSDFDVRSLQHWR